MEKEEATKVMGRFYRLTAHTPTVKVEESAAAWTMKWNRSPKEKQLPKTPEETVKESKSFNDVVVDLKMAFFHEDPKKNF